MRSASPDSLPTDDDIDLPPVDGEADGEGDDAVNEDTDSDDLDPVPADAGKSALDDETGEDDPVDDDELDPVDDGGLDDVAAGAGSDFEDLPEFPDDRGSKSATLLDDDVLGVGAEDFGLREDASTTSIDAGEEGPTEADEDLREEDLPLLDADGDGDGGGEDNDFYELDGVDAPPFAWEDDRWVCKAIEGVPAAVAIVGVGSGAVAIAGDPPKLWGIVEGLAEAIAPEGAPPGGWRSLRLARRTGELFVETDSGVFVSRDAGRHFIGIPEDSEAPARSRSLRDTQREIHSRDVDLRGLTIGAAAIIDEAGTVLAAVSRTANALGKTWLVRFSAGSPPRSVGVVSGAVWDLSWDEPRARVWVASDAGVLLFTSHESGANSTPKRSVRPGA